MILEIVDARMRGAAYTDEEIAARLSLVEPHPSTAGAVVETVENGVGILQLMGPIFGKANLLTEMSGATSLDMFQSDLNKMLADPAVRSILLHIDSPGGTSDGVAETANMIASAKKKKPIYALADSQAGSAAYWLMSQATQGYSTLSGSVGSIGVYTVHVDQSQADRQEGLNFSFISAGKYKTEGNPHEPLTAEAEQYRQEVVDETYADFVSGVAAGRGVPSDTVLSNYGQGRMLTSKKALDAGMIDGITTFDSLVGNMASQAQERPVQVFFGDQAAGPVAGPVAGLLRGGAVYLEHKEEEHADPGTGTPPAPRRDQAGEDDPAIVTGSRRDPLPVPLGAPSSPKAVNFNKGGDTVLTPEQISELYVLFGLTPPTEITADTDHSELLDSIKAAKGGLTTRQRKFAEEFPEEYATMQAQTELNCINAAERFVSGIGNFKRMEGEKEVPTNYGLSALALENMKELHIKFAKGEATVSEFESFVQSLMSGAVEFGERGTKGAAPAKEVSFDLSTAQGIRETRQLFFDKIQEIQLEGDGMTFEEAMKVAAKKYPDLAQAYATTPVS